MRSAARRHLERLLGPAPAESPAEGLSQDALTDRVLADPERIASGLVDEALASDDVMSAGEARAFVDERLAEWGDLLEKMLLQRLASLASAEVERRAPGG